MQSAQQAPIKEPVYEAEPTVFLATLASRFMASAIDLLLMLLSVGLWVLLAYAWPLQPTAIWLTALLLFYHPALLDCVGGSIGKRLMGITVVTLQGQRPNILVSLWRHSMKYWLHFLLPIVWKLIEGLFFGERYGHEVVSRTVVIQKTQAHLDQQTVAQARLETTAASGLFDAVKGVLTWAFIALVVAGFSWVGWGLYLESKDPAMSAVTDKRDQIKPLLKYIAQHKEAQHNYALTAEQLAAQAKALAVDTYFAEIRLDEGSGIVATRIKGGPMDGKSLLFKPVTNKAKNKVKKWRCGSPDIPSEQLPSGCKDSTDPTTEATE